MARHQFGSTNAALACCAMLLMLSGCSAAPVDPDRGSGSGGPITLSFLADTVHSVVELDVATIDHDRKVAHARVTAVLWQLQRENLPEDIDVWWHLQDLRTLSAGDDMVAWLTHTPEELEFKDGRSAWRTTYAFRDESLLPYPGDGGPVRANQQLQVIYREAAADTREERLSTSLRYLDSQHPLAASSPDLSVED